MQRQGRNKSIIVLITLFCIFINVNLVLSTQVEPVDDAEVLEDTPAGNFGTLNETITQSRNTHAEISYYAFDLSNVSLNVKYANFTYYVYSVANPTAANNITFLYCNDPGFDETTLTWNNRNTEVANCNTTHPLFNRRHNNWTANKWYTFSLNSTVNKELTSGDKKFVIKSTFTNIADPTTSRNIKVTSRESVDNMESYLNFETIFNFNVSFPVLNKHYNFYNGSLMIYSGANMWCSVNNTNWTLNSSVPSTTLRFVNPNTPINEDRYSIFINCTRETTLEKYNRTINFTIDRTYPDIFVINPSNNSIKNKNMTLTIRYYDLYLYATNTTVRFLGNNSVIFNRLNTSMTGTNQWHNLTHLLDIASLPNGNYSIFMTAADTHTAAIFSESPKEEIREITEKGIVKKELILKMKKGDISFNYPSELDIKTKKEKDRIIFEYRTDNIMIDMEYTIKADKIVYYPDSPYKNHLIINNKYWYDTEGLPESYIEKINDKEYKIKYKQINKLEASRSLGGLNEINSTSYFSVDKTTPNMTYNSTIGYGNNIIFRFNATEPVKYNATILLRNCTGNISRLVSNSSYSVSHYFRQRYFNLNDTYYIKIQITDNANNNRTYCQNVTTGEYENYIDSYYYSIDYTGNQIKFYISAIDTNDHQMIFNYTAYKNGVLTNSYIANYYPIDVRYIYKPDNIMYYQTNNFINSSLQRCLLDDEDHINLRWFSNNSLAGNNLELSCDNGTAWTYITDIPSESRIFDEYMSFDIFNNSVLTVESLNYTALGNWTNISLIFDGNPATNAECNVGFENCYLYLTYPRYYQTLYNSSVLYNLFNFSNLSTGSYYTMISVWDGRYVYPVINASLVISFNANIYNELNGQLLDDRLSQIFVISENVIPAIIKYQNTTTGTWNILDLIVADYNIQYEAFNHLKRHYYLMGDDLNLNGTLNLFALNSSVGDFSIVRVVDNEYMPVVGAIVKVYKNIPNFADKQIISVIKTNEEGEVTLDFKKYTDNYQFAVYLNGRLLKLTDETQISKDIIVIQLDADISVFDSYRMYQNAIAFMNVYNGTTSNKTCIFSYSGVDLQGGKIEVVKRGLLDNDIVICNDSSSSSTDTLICDFNISANYLYICSGYLDTNSTGSWYLSNLVSVSQSMGRNIFGKLGLLLSMILTLAFSIIFREKPSLMILTVLGGLILMGLAGFISIPYAGLIVIIMIGVYFIYKMRD